MTDHLKISKAIELSIAYSGHDGVHHKAWLIDQMMRILMGDSYINYISEFCDNHDVGIPP